MKGMNSKSKRKKARRQKPAGEVAPQPAAIPDAVEAARKEFHVAEDHYKDLLRHIKGRLTGQEWLVADAAWKLYFDARVRLMKVAQQAEVSSRAGTLLEAPEREVIPKRITPFALAAVAALLTGNSETATASLPKARQLLIDAAGYLEDCQTETIVRFMDGISFEEILQKQDKNASPLSKWLPGITTSKGLEKLIRRYYTQQCRPFTTQELEQVEKRQGRRLTEEVRNRLMETGGNKLQIEQGENVIESRKLRLPELMKIRAWRTAQRRKNAS